jgi:hypothetical protein
LYSLTLIALQLRCGNCPVQALPASRVVSQYDYQRGGLPKRGAIASDRGLLIAGEQQESLTGETYDDVNPYTGQAIATVAAAFSPGAGSARWRARR